MDVGTLVAKLTLDGSGLTRGLVTAERKVGKAFVSMDNHFVNLQKKVFSLQTAFISLAGTFALKKVSSSFMEAAKSAENYEVRLSSTLGGVKEGSKAFKDMAAFAATVPYSYDEIMASTTNLSGIMKGGIQEIKQYMPMITDLAAVSGLSIGDVTGQVIRMYSAGAASADMFRERGITAMMGFKQGVHYTAEETRRMMFESWNAQDSKFKNVSLEMAKTWTGTMSMLGDKWQQFRVSVMQSGVFDFLKTGANLVLDELNRMQKEGRLDKWAKDMSDNVVDSLGFISLAAAGVGDVFRGWKIIWHGLAMAFAGFAKYVGVTMQDMAKPVAMYYKHYIDLLEIQKSVSSKIPVIGEALAKDTQKAIDSLKDTMSKGFGYSYEALTREAENAKAAEYNALEEVASKAGLTGKVNRRLIIKPEIEMPGREDAKEIQNFWQKILEESDKAVRDVANQESYWSKISRLLDTIRAKTEQYRKEREAAINAPDKKRTLVTDKPNKVTTEEEKLRFKNLKAEAESYYKWKEDEEQSFLKVAELNGASELQIKLDSIESQKYLLTDYYNTQKSLIQQEAATRSQEEQDKVSNAEFINAKLLSLDLDMQGKRNDIENQSRIVTAEIEKQKTDFKLEQELKYLEAVKQLRDKETSAYVKNLEAQQRKAKENHEFMKNAFNGWANSFAGNLNDMLWNSDFTFGEIAKSFGKMITQMMIQMKVIKPMMESIFGSSSGGGLFGTIGTIIKGIGGFVGLGSNVTSSVAGQGFFDNAMPASQAAIDSSVAFPSLMEAKGDIFTKGKVLPSAKGNVFQNKSVYNISNNRPTAFARGDVFSTNNSISNYRTISKPMAFAKGDVFSTNNNFSSTFNSNKSVVPFAKGTVVTKPTLFPMADGATGLMGEKGFEAIMPLSRDASGKLGVSAKGLYNANGNETEAVNNNYNITIQAIDSESFQQFAKKNQKVFLMPFLKDIEKGGSSVSAIKGALQS